MKPEKHPSWWRIIGRAYSVRDGRFCYRPHRWAEWRPVRIIKVMGPLYISGELLRRWRRGDVPFPFRSFG